MALLDYIRGGHTGVRGHQVRLNVISNNIANIGTVGFKRSYTQSFESYLDQVTHATDAPGNTSTVDELNRGFGIRAMEAFIDSRPGEYVQTGNSLDLAVQNSGYFIVENDGRQLYTRDGTMTLDRDKNLIQTSTSSFIKGYKADLNPDGTTSVEIGTDLERITFKHLEFLPFRSTNLVNFASNLNSDSSDRKIQVVKNLGKLTDANGREQVLDTRWKTLGPQSFEYQIIQNKQPAFKAELEVDSLGNVVNWVVPEQEGVEVSTDEQGRQRHVTYTYNSEMPDGTFERLAVTTTLPLKSDATSTQILLNHLIRPGRPGDEGFEDQDPVRLSSEYTKGTVHQVFSEVVDSKGVAHDIGYDFEHIDTATNRWEYRVSLSEDDPLIQSYLRNPLNGVQNPDRPAAVDLEKAKDAVFGLSRVGLIHFSENGFPDKEKSIIPDVVGNAQIIETQKVGSTTLNTPDGSTNLPLDIYVTPEGAGFRYELLLPASNEHVLALANDPTNRIEEPNNLKLNDLRKINRQIFSQSNQGTLVFDRDGNLDPQRSVTPTVTGSLPQGSVSSPVPLSLFDGVRSSFRRSLDSDQGTIEMKMDMSLISGFGGEFSTAVREQNGYVDGLLKKTSITSTGDGVLVGNYTNKQFREIGQLGLAVFRNTSGLVKQGTNLFRIGDNTGVDENSIGIPNSFTRGLVHPGIQEHSNVNLINEFTNLIITQRAFQANSKVITTTDSVLQTGISIKR
jgi:flagellar hook-basal body protein